MTRHEAAVLSAALLWWKGHRPLGWSPEQHLKEPAVNVATAGAERLAEAVARYVAADKEQGE